MQKHPGKRGQEAGRSILPLDANSWPLLVNTHLSGARNRNCVCQAPLCPHCVRLQTEGKSHRVQAHSPGELQRSNQIMTWRRHDPVSVALPRWASQQFHLSPSPSPSVQLPPLSWCVAPSAGGYEEQGHLFKSNRVTATPSWTTVPSLQICIQQ
jgi:hypothetical protein